MNDALGHPAGDRLLVDLAERMAGPLRPEDAVARLGGDEFVILAEDLRHATDALAIAERVAAAATGLYRLGPALQSNVTLSIGVDTGSGTLDADTLLAHADAALYEAKRRGRNRIEAFDPAQRKELVRRMHVEHELHRALDEDELTLHWQPIVRADGAEVIAAEALLRWEHPEQGLLGAQEFLPIAEHAGLMPRICEWVLARAVDQAAGWAELPDPLRVFVNLSGAELVSPSLPDDVLALAQERRVDPGRVHFEISERMLTTELAPVRRQLHALRDARVRPRPGRLRRRQHGAGLAAGAADRPAQARSPLRPHARQPVHAGHRRVARAPGSRARDRDGGGGRRVRGGARRAARPRLRLRAGLRPRTAAARRRPHRAAGGSPRPALRAGRGYCPHRRRRRRGRR